MFEEPRTWRWYQPARVSSRTCAGVKVIASRVKWPQKITTKVQRLRSRLAAALPSSTGRKNGPASSGKNR